MSVIWHQSGVNPKGEPFVQLLRDDHIVGQMTVLEAREHAAAVLQAAEAAEQDAFLIDFARHQIGMSLPEACKILIAMREYRAKTTGKSQGPTSPRHWVMPQDGSEPRP